MQKITSTELARNLRAVLDRVKESGEEYIVERGRRAIVRLTPTAGHLTAEQALADLYRTLPEDAGDEWLKDARRGDDSLSDELRDPWGT